MNNALAALDRHGLGDREGRVYDSPFSALESGAARTVIFGVNGASLSDAGRTNLENLLRDIEQGFDNVQVGLDGGWHNRRIPNRIREVAVWRGEPIHQVIVTNCYLECSRNQNEVMGRDQLLKQSMAFHEEVTFQPELEVVVTHGAVAAEVFRSRYGGGLRVQIADGPRSVSVERITIMGRPVTLVSCRHFSRSSKFPRGNIDAALEALEKVAPSADTPAVLQIQQSVSPS